MSDLVMMSIESPVGPLRLFGRGERLVGVYMHLETPSDSREGTSKILVEARKQLTAYFKGALTDFDLPLAPEGTPFQLEVWKALRAIPFGETWSYVQLAKKIGRPTASRAVGAANGRNPHGIIVPCHRVIGANGALVGYGGGMPAKKWLLAHEQRQLSLAC